MSIILKVKETESVMIPEGLYKATVKQIEEGTGNFGDYLKFIFEISEGEFMGVIKNTIASKKLTTSKSGKSSKLYDIVEAINKEKPTANEDLDIEELLGKSCQILVKNDKEKDGITYQSISMVMPS